MKISWPIYFIVGLFLLVSVNFVQAQTVSDMPDAAAGAMPAVNDDIIRVTPDNVKFVRLNEDAASVVVTNPNHASVMLDSPRLLVIMPRNPGATSFAVLNVAGETIIEKKIIVSGVEPKYVRIRRMCSPADASCVPASYYYCPDGCYEVSTVAPIAGVPVPEFVASGPSSQHKADNMIDQEMQSEGINQQDVDEASQPPAGAAPMSESEGAPALAPAAAGEE